MAVKKKTAKKVEPAAPDPEFYPGRPFAEVHGPVNYRYTQGGHRFNGAGIYVGPDE